MEWLLLPETWVALATLTALEIVLGIDNIVFISVLAGRLPPDQQGKARSIGLSVALVTRILLLLSIAWVMGLTEPVVSVLGWDGSGRDIILLIGGLFLLAKSTTEIHHEIEGGHDATKRTAAGGLVGTIVQIGLLDIVFSLDSVITAVGLAEDVRVMITAVVIAIIVMLVAAKSVGEFVEEHPTVKMLALSFLVLIGTMLVADGLHHHIPKGYVYFAMAFAFLVELLNMRVRRSRDVASA